MIPVLKRPEKAKYGTLYFDRNDDSLWLYIGEWARLSVDCPDCANKLGVQAVTNRIILHCEGCTRTFFW